MDPSARLVTFVSLFLGAGGCGVVLPPQDLDDTACLYVDVGASCPSEDDASDQLVGTTTCETPVREVVATGAFLSEADVVFDGYGGVFPVTTASDTGLSDPMHQCCYEAAYKVNQGEGCVIGRPLVVDGQMVSACAAPTSGWVGPQRPSLAGLSAGARQALAEAWTDAGLLEHASIPAFARVSLDLVALGAPAELVARTAAAMADEVRHAEACFALASAYAGRPVGPSGLRAPGRRGRVTLRKLAVETFREGCVGETLAVGVAAAQLREARDPAVRAVLAGIVADEGRHAALAWDIVRWAIAAGGEPVRRAVAREVARLEVPAIGSAGVYALEGRGHGLPDPDAVREALAGVLDEVIHPSARDLLAA